MNKIKARDRKFGKKIINKRNQTRASAKIRQKNQELQDFLTKNLHLTVQQFVVDESLPADICKCH